MECPVTSAASRKKKRPPPIHQRRLRAAPNHATTHTPTPPGPGTLTTRSIGFSFDTVVSIVHAVPGRLERYARWFVVAPILGAL